MMTTSRGCKRPFSRLSIKTAAITGTLKREGPGSLSIGFRLACPRQPGRVFVSPFAEASAHPGRQRHARLTELVSQAISGGQRIFPALLPAPFKQIDLLRLRLKGRRLHPQQPHWTARLPVLAKKSARLLEDFAIKLRRNWQRMSASDRCEVLIAQLELNRARVQLRLPQASSDHFGKPHQRCSKLVHVRSVFVKSVFVTD